MRYAAASACTLFRLGVLIFSEFCRGRLGIIGDSSPLSGLLQQLPILL